MQYLGIYSYELCLIIIIYLTSCRVSSIGMTCEHLVKKKDLILSYWIYFIEPISLYTIDDGELFISLTFDFFPGSSLLILIYNSNDKIW